MKSDSSSLSFLQTCSCSTCTCSNNKIKSDYFENNNDCLTYAFITLYESSIWCMEIIYELFLKSLWHVLLYIKQELQNRQSVNKIISSVDMISINNSASANDLLICKKKNYYSEERNRRRYTIFSEDKTSHQTLSQEKDDSCIVVVPVRSSYCQTEISKNDVQTINIDLNQSEKNIHEQLTDTFCRRLQQPLIFMNREMCYRTSFFSTVPSYEKKELSFNEGANKIIYSANRNNKFNESSLRIISNSIDNSQPLVSDVHQRKSSQKKSKQKRQIIDDNNIPLALATSLHSNVSLYNVDSFLTKYIHQLFIDKHNLR